MGKKRPPRVKLDIEWNPGRSLDKPQPKKQRASRPYQQGPVNVPGRRRGQEADEDEGEAARSSSGAGSNFVPWGVRRERAAEQFEAQMGTCANMFIASQPQQVEQQRTWRGMLLDWKQTVLRAAEPSCCERAAGAGSCCQFITTGEQDVVYFGLGGVVGRLKQPIFECKVHGCTSLTAHPLQFSCVPTAPVKNTKLLDIELVEEYRLLQLKDGVGAHGERCSLRILLPSLLVGWCMLRATVDGCLFA